jgi:hypothetical protein
VTLLFVAATLEDEGLSPSPLAPTAPSGQCSKVAILCLLGNNENEGMRHDETMDLFSAAGALPYACLCFCG